MQTITWLHISDLHTNNPKHGWEYDKITDKLVKDLEKMREDHRLVPDFIFFTGDAATRLSGGHSD
jgi:3',5'-cyclic AMP phosphodiesterase CpdA